MALARDTEKLGLAAEQLERRVELLALVDRAVLVELAVDEQQRRPNPVDVRQRRLAPVALGLPPRATRPCPSRSRSGRRSSGIPTRNR